MDNPIHKIAVGYHQYGKDNGRLPKRVFVHPDTFTEIGRHIGDERLDLSFQFVALTVEVDAALAPGELKFAD